MIERLAAATRRSDGDVEVVAQSILAGSAEQIADQIRPYVDAGVTHIIMNIQPPYDAELLRRFAREVIPKFRAAD